MKFLVKDNTEKNQYFYADHCDEVLVATELSDVLPTLNKVEELQQAGYWLAGWISYEASPAFDARHKVKGGDSDMPLAYFMAVKSVQKLALEQLAILPEISLIDEISPLIDQSEYKTACSQVLDYIREGDIYQANYSFRCNFPLDVDPLALFLTLERQHPVPYSFYMDNDQWQVLSQSPELFLSRQGNDLVSIPMKGTIKRAPEFEADEKLRLELTLDEKSKAENVMIVDLMRNDMSRVCELNSVQVPELFASTRYASLHQLTSTVAGKLSDETGVVDILKATFPAGSITGAPKIRAMEIIDELEKGGRGLYTGSAGIFKPGGDFLLNVCIRTIVCTSGQAVIGIGSGVVADSAQNLEWEECLLKSSFINFRRRHSEIFETMLWQNGEILFWQDHLQRLQKSCLYFSSRFPQAEIEQLVAQKCHSFSQGSSYRLRLSVSVDQQIHLQVDEIPSPGWPSAALKVKVSEQRLNSSNPYLYHKTDARALYNEELRQAQADGYDEVIFFNDQGHVCEGSISSIFLQLGQCWYTPQLSCGLLPGTWRKNKLTELKAVEKVLTLDDLRAAEKVILGNSVRLSAEVDSIT